MAVHPTDAKVKLDDFDEKFSDFYILKIHQDCIKFRMILNTITLKVESPGVYTSQGVPISVTGIAQVTARLICLNVWIR